MGRDPLPSPTAGAGRVKADDFKLIKGIGPVVERRLHDAGILTFAQLGALSPADIAGLVGNVTGLSTERIAQQDWTSQARRLITRSIASFSALQSLVPQFSGTVTSSDKSKPILQTLATAPIGTAGWYNLLYQGQPFNIYLVLDLTEVDTSSADLLDYRIIVYAKRMGRESLQAIAEMNGTSDIVETLTMRTPGSELPTGLYRLEAAINLALRPAKADLSVFLPGSLLQIY